MDLKVLISKLIGYAIVGFSFIFKLTQIVTIINTKSAEGLSEFSCMTEIFVYLNTALYSFHLGLAYSTYLENVIILAQTLIILLLLYLFSKSTSFIQTIQRLTFIPMLIVISYFCLEDKLITKNNWQLIASSPLFFMSLSKLTQIINSYRLQSTGPLSMITALLGITGNITRGFTLVVESGDLLLILNQVYSLSLNFITMVQIIIYRPKAIEETKGKDKLN